MYVLVDICTHARDGGASAALLPAPTPKVPRLCLLALVFFGPRGGGRRLVGVSRALGLGVFRWWARRASRSGTMALGREGRRGGGGGEKARESRVSEMEGRKRVVHSVGCAT